MSKTPLGKLDCPIAAAYGEPHEGEVFETDSKKKPLYWRCQCGTIQALFPQGQAFIRKAMKPLSLEETDAAKQTAAADAEHEAEEAAKKGRKESGLISKFLKALQEESE